MGHAKNKQMEYEDRGYFHSDKFFCAECFGDPYLKQYIRKNGSRGKCSFCKDNHGGAAVRNVLSVDDIMAVLMQIIREDYKPALDWAMYDSEEECYLEPVFDPFDFVTEELNQYMECENDDVL